MNETIKSGATEVVKGMIAGIKLTAAAVLVGWAFDGAGVANLNKRKYALQAKARLQKR
jgi:hypothetical protein